jgi:mycothiol synthase
MRRSLSEPLPPAELPAGYTLRALRGDEELAAWVEAFNESFVDAWDFHPQTLEDARHFLRGDPCYRRELDLVAEASDGTIAAFCLSTINPAENERHERLEGGIRLLGTRRGHRGQGLGRAMLLAGLHLLRDEGMESAWLGVDSSSPTGATRLYESAGFFVEHNYAMWLVELEPVPSS